MKTPTQEDHEAAARDPFEKPSPEPSAESLREAEDRLDEWDRKQGGRFRLIVAMALMRDAAKRSSRREALGQAAELIEAESDSGDYRDMAVMLRALMEAE